MINSGSVLGYKARVNAMVLASVLLATSAQTEAQPARKQLQQQSQEQEQQGQQLQQQSQQLEQQSQEQRRLEAWREAIIQVPRPKKGCFIASPPKMEWQEVPCTTAPPYPMPPRRGLKPFIIGNGSNVSALVPTAGSFIATATGTFDSDTGVTSVSSPIGNAGAPVNDAYTLQLNTDFFTSTACAGSPNPNCQGWEQFVFANNSSASGNKGAVFIQYWLLEYNTTCPAGAGWIQFQFTGDPDIYCYRNSATVGVLNNTPITNLDQLSLTGTVSAGADNISFWDGTTIYSTAGDNSVNAAAGWDTAEFGVFGYGGNSNGGGMATFNNGSTIVPRTRIVYGGIAAPTCVAIGFTGETNNLNFGPAAPVATGPGPAVLSTQSSAGGSTSNCAAATTVGDTHLATFGGLLYDFQASGDFVLAQTDSDFVVQARQVSGAPTWPNASVNSAVATQMGNTKVAICLAPERLVIGDETVNLEDGKILALPDGVDIFRKGNAYFIRGQRGDSVRAVLHNGWMDVSVGLGRWPIEVRGLLFNTERFEIETRDGEVLGNPVSFKDLYHTYGNSWRVPLKESLLAVCGEEIEEGSPEELFYAEDLEPDLFRRARAICAELGVTEESLLDACTLDVTVIGAKTAADVFAGAPPPIAVMEPTP